MQEQSLKIERVFDVRIELEMSQNWAFMNDSF